MHQRRYGENVPEVERVVFLQPGLLELPAVDGSR